MGHAKDTYSKNEIAYVDLKKHNKYQILKLIIKNGVINSSTHFLVL